MTYIQIPNWSDFQHADVTKRGRAPVWIRNYTRLLSNDDYLSLTPTQRATLHGIWLEHARSGGKVPENTSKLSRRLGLRVTKRTLEALERKGFIVICQDNGLTLSRLEERRGEKTRAVQVEETGEPSETNGPGAIDFINLLKDMVG